MQPRYQIFISSTYEDLKEARRAVQDAIMSIHHFPVGMEYFGAANENQWDHIKDEIDNSDYYVLIIGHRYGSVIQDGPDKGISYTEKEFNYAVEKGVPVLAFIIDKNAPVRPDQIDTELEKVAALEKFKGKVKDKWLIDFWENSAALPAKVIAALHNEIAKNKRPGWVRADSITAQPETSEKTKTKSKTAKITKKPSTGSSEERVLEVLRYSKEIWSIREIAEEIGMASATVSRVLTKLVEKGVVQKTASGRFTRYIYHDPKHPREGQHRVLGTEGRILSEGIWDNYELVEGIEYDWIICDEDNVLTYNPETKDYDGDADANISKYMPFYDSEYQFQWMYAYLQHEGLEKFYICDIRVKDNTEEYFHIRKFGDWLKENDSAKYIEVTKLMQERI